MITKRDDDQATKSWFRSSRMFQQDGIWFFLTREGSTEGPFGDMYEAQLRLDNYIKVMQSGMLTDDPDQSLTILPKD